jgi:hypothetical protein
MMGGHALIIREVNRGIDRCTLCTEICRKLVNLLRETFVLQIYF